MLAVHACDSTHAHMHAHARAHAHTFSSPCSAEQHDPSLQDFLSIPWAQPPSHTFQRTESLFQMVKQTPSFNLNLYRDFGAVIWAQRQLSKETVSPRVLFSGPCSSSASSLWTLLCRISPRRQHSPGVVTEIPACSQQAGWLSPLGWEAALARDRAQARRPCQHSYFCSMAWTSQHTALGQFPPPLKAGTNYCPPFLLWTL